MNFSSTTILRTLTFSAGAVAAGWGIVEIFLRVNPFKEAYFKYAVSLGVALMAVFIACLVSSRSELARSSHLTIVRALSLGAIVVLAIEYCLKSGAGFEELWLLQEAADGNSYRRQGNGWLAYTEQSAGNVSVLMIVLLFAAVVLLSGLVRDALPRLNASNDHAESRARYGRPGCGHQSSSQESSLAL